MLYYLILIIVLISLGYFFIKKSYKKGWKEGFKYNRNYRKWID